MTENGAPRENAKCKMQNAKLNFQLFPRCHPERSEGSGRRKCKMQSAKCKINFQLSIFNFPFLNFFVSLRMTIRRFAIRGGYQPPVFSLRFAGGCYPPLQSNMKVEILRFAQDDSEKS